MIGVGGFLRGDGWFFSNLPVEHRVSLFLTTLEAKDYAKAYGIWMNDPDWQQHPQKYEDTLQRLTQEDPGRRRGGDWGPIKSHHVDISKRTGTGVIVAVRVNDSPKKMFMWYEKSNGTLTYPKPPYNLEY